MGYSINPAFWGCGFATEAAREVISYAFEFLEFEKELK
ncbi:MAG: GNAT family N-acetyltransferase [Bacilli bacterium]